MSIEVKKAGLSTSVQDGGREGFYHLGIPPCGALDQYSMQTANLLVGNDENAPGIECTLMGPELVFHQPTAIAICGAMMNPALDGQAMAMNTCVRVKTGQTLSFGFASAGARCYIAVAKGLQLPQMLGSCSTYGIGRLGGVDGRLLAAGDQLPISAVEHVSSLEKSIPEPLLPDLDKHADIRVVTGLYAHRLTEESLDGFFDDIWTVGTEADRMGYRFKGGRALEFKPRTQPFGAGSDPSNIVDACYPIGSIQVPAGKEPIVLHRDAVSGGGYAMIGTVISSDLDRIAQLQPNHQVRFIRVSLEQALAARRDRTQRLAQLKHYLNDLNS